MPLRPPAPLFYAKACLARPRLRFFTTTPARRSDDVAQQLAKKNHYERLRIKPTATKGEIKKAFYSLSKKHHPDANPSAPATAAQSFSLLSESYSILSNDTTRAKYDRTLAPASASGVHHPRGSYHSAGGRPASGLSRRRGTYRGPPPSFYRSGGYGEHTEKRQKAHEDTTFSGAGGARASSEKKTNHHHGGMGPGDDPFGHHDDVLHWDRKSHHKTQKREDHRRWARTHKKAWNDDGTQFEPQMSQGSHFMVVLGLLSISLVAPALYMSKMHNKKNDRR